MALIVRTDVFPLHIVVDKYFFPSHSLCLFIGRTQYCDFNPCLLLIFYKEGKLSTYLVLNIIIILL